MCGLVCNAQRGSAEQQSAASKGRLELWVGESVLNVPLSWQADPKMCELIPTFRQQMIVEVKNHPTLVQIYL